MIFNMRRYFSTSAVKRVGVLGSGQMGTGIGIVASRVANLEVVFVDPIAESLKKSESFVQKWCKKEIEK
jgi:3-hydroxybutyryl-CoA dehydrogenase